jgi:hypothetical protein
MNTNQVLVAVTTDGLPRFGTGACVIDEATIRRIRDMAKRVERDGLTLQGCMKHAVNIAQEWTKPNSTRANTSAQRCWKTFCATYKVPPPIDNLAIAEREYIGIAFVGYMIKTIRPAKGDHAAAGTVKNCITAVRNLHKAHGVRFDVLLTAGTSLTNAWLTWKHNHLQILPNHWFH